jgi:2-amino-4-hydroxy-6-hydroxymethyldihydropteridine diphosphokinase
MKAEVHGKNPPGEVEIYLAFGANLGNRVAAIRTGVETLRRAGVEAIAFSSLYHSKAKYMADQPPFVNLVGRFRTALDPRRLLDACQAAEHSAGRQKRERYGPRELDVDILLYGDREVAEEGLTIPHTALKERLFMLVPLGELAPGLLIPGLGAIESLRDAAEASLPEEERAIDLGTFVPERGRVLDGSVEEAGP